MEVFRKRLVGCRTIQPVLSALPFVQLTFVAQGIGEDRPFVGSTPGVWGNRYFTNTDTHGHTALIIAGCPGGLQADPAHQFHQAAGAFGRAGCALRGIEAVHAPQASLIRGGGVTESQTPSDSQNSP